jgi:hypothetical protein
MQPLLIPRTQEKTNIMVGYGEIGCEYIDWREINEDRIQ